MLLKKWINNKTKLVYLIEPNFPIPNKSRNHKDFLPIGLLKIATYFRNNDINVKLIRHNEDEFNSNNIKKPDLIFVSSIFTYWAEYVSNTVKFYKNIFPDVPVIVGGIYASLLPEHCENNTGCDEVIQGTIEEVEDLEPSYDLVDVDYQIIHASRGCIRNCVCCGVYNIEPEWEYKKTIKDEIFMKKIIFYDNNLIANPYIEDILDELINLKNERKISYIESQSGFDGRILIKKPNIAVLIKRAGLRNPKIAWDGPVSDSKSIFKQIKILTTAGYKPKEISVFMIYNHDLDYEELEEKRVFCFEWGVQITDCRFRPLDSTQDHYNPHKISGQTEEDYHINPNWSDSQIRLFRRNIRRHNICIRHDLSYHSYLMERKKISKKLSTKYRKKSYDQVLDIISDAWDPSIFHFSK